jgi:hypothetical protein
MAAHGVLVEEFGGLRVQELKSSKVQGKREKDNAETQRSLRNAQKNEDEEKSSPQR